MKLWAIEMFDFIEKIIREFRTCFTRNNAFKWFVIIIIGLMIRTDFLGTTSVIRDLCLDGKLYTAMNSFFRADSWTIEGIFEKWCAVLLKYAPLMRDDNGSVIIAGDGIKISKEARYMPGVKKHHQDSENSGKAEYIFGHLFGGTGVIATNTSKILCIPLFMNIQDGLKTIFSWPENKERQQNHVEQIADNVCSAVKYLGKAILLLDRYFLNETLLVKINKWNEQNPDKLIRLVTIAKSNVVAYEKPEKKTGRGRPRKRGNTVHLKNFFDDMSQFTEASVYMYGTQKTVRYLCKNLLWKQGLYQELRFVLVESEGRTTILATTDLSMEPLKVIRMYSYRFKIESVFKVMKQSVGLGCYHFWSKSMVKLNRFKNMEELLEKIESEKDKNKILKTVEAIEKYIMLCCISTGIIQLSALVCNSILDDTCIEYRRSVSNPIISEEFMARYIRKNIFRFMFLHPDSFISQFILEKSSSYSSVMPDKSA